MSTVMRRLHRVLSIIFTVSVIAAMIGAAVQAPAWVFYLPLAPLLLMMISGLYMFFLPYVRNRNTGQPAAARS